MMKKLFVAFMVLGFLASSGAWGSEETKVNPVEAAQNDTSFVGDTYNQMISLAQDTTMQLVSSSYKSISSIFNNIISILLATIAVFWMFKHIKNGTINKEEVYKALMFLIVFAIVYVLLNSKDAFNGIFYILNIPQHLVNSALAMDSGSVAERLNKSFAQPFSLLGKIAPATFSYYMDNASLWETVGAIVVGVTMGGVMTLVYGVFIIFNLALNVAITIIQMYATFLAGIYSIFLPLTLSLILIPQTKGIFFANIKSYIGITMYIPLSMLPISIMQAAMKIFTAENINFLILKLPYYTLVGIICCVIGIMLLYKMPTWISELLGVANQGVGAGGAVGMLKSGGKGIATATQGYASSVKNSITSPKSTGGKIAAGIGNAVTGGGYGVAAAGFTAMAKGITQFSRNRKAAKLKKERKAMGR